MANDNNTLIVIVSDSNDALILREVREKFVAMYDNLSEFELKRLYHHLQERCIRTYTVQTNGRCKVLHSLSGRLPYDHHKGEYVAFNGPFPLGEINTNYAIYEISEPLGPTDEVHSLFTTIEYTRTWADLNPMEIVAAAYAINALDVMRAFIIAKEEFDSRLK